MTIPKRIINFLCGFESGKNKNSFEVNEAKVKQELKTPEELAREAAEFLDEPPFWKK